MEKPSCAIEATDLFGPVTDQDRGVLQGWLSDIKKQMHEDVFRKSQYFGFNFERDMPLEHSDSHFTWERTELPTAVTLPLSNSLRSTLPSDDSVCPGNDDGSLKRHQQEAESEPEFMLWKQM